MSQEKSKKAMAALELFQVLVHVGVPADEPSRLHVEKLEGEGFTRVLPLSSAVV